MALSKKQIRRKELQEADEIAKMRNDVLNAIKRDEKAAAIPPRISPNKKNPIIHKKIKSKKFVRKKKKVPDVCDKPVQQEEVSEPRPITTPVNLNVKDWKVKNIVILFLTGLVLGCFIMAAIIFYIPKSESLLARKISKVIPFPAIIINSRFISYNDYLAEVDSVELFLTRQQRVGITQELLPRKQIREKIADILITQEIIKNLSNQYGIIVSQKEIDDEVNRLKEQSRSEESFDKILKDLYGWSEEEFGNKVIRNDLLISKLSGEFFPDVSGGELKELFDKKIEEIKKEMNIYVLVK